MTWNSIWPQLYVVSFAANVMLATQLIATQLIARPWNQQRVVIQFLSLTLALVSVLILTVDGINLLNSFQYQHFQPWAYFLLVATALGFSWLSIRALWTAKSKIEVRLLAVVLTVLLMMASCWSWQRLNGYALDSDFSIYECTPGALVEDTEHAAFTRAGSTVRLYRLQADPEEFARYASAIEARDLMASGPVIVVDRPNKEYNCHGWVFTGGKHLLRGSDVEQILKDNGYQSTNEPQANDIVIYRAEDGRILHTGLVRAILGDGTILIESKWGASGRYLHRPENQPYSARFEYYRGSGQTHLIQMNDVQSISHEVIPLAAG